MAARPSGRLRPSSAGYGGYITQIVILGLTAMASAALIGGDVWLAFARALKYCGLP